jgi:translation initiation factor IF-3
MGVEQLFATPHPATDTRYAGLTGEPVTGRSRTADSCPPFPRPGQTRHRKGDAPISTTDARINDRIRAREVRLVGADGEQIGVKPLPEALHIAREHDLDLVEVAPNANPPVCKIMDFGKFKYEQDVRRKESRRKTTNVVIKEMKFRPKIDEHDYTTKTKHVERFLNEGSKVKITIMFRGREMAHPELGKKILDRIAEQVKDVGNVEASPRVDGRNMLMVLAPVKKVEPKSTKPAGDKAKQSAPPAPAEALVSAPAPAPAESAPVPAPAESVPASPTS